MPKNPVPKGTLVEPIPNAWLKGNPECVNRCVHLIGGIVIQWSLIEAVLAQIYSNLACMPEVNNVATTAHWIAIETFERIQSIAQKRGALLAACDKRDISAATKNKLAHLMTRAQELYNESRIPSAHGKWMLPRQYMQDSLVFIRNAGKSEAAELYSVADLIKDLQDLTTLGHGLSDFVYDTLIPELNSKTA